MSVLDKKNVLIFLCINIFIIFVEIKTNVIMEITGYKCSCGIGTINKTTEKLPNGTNKIGVYPCTNCGNQPHLFALKNYENVETIKQ